jgi:hypothetical protein
MILARAIEHMRQQHWTGVFIELVIVVLGVFIGLQVNNWNEARHGFARPSPGRAWRPCEGLLKCP